jgi:hypothetical protein
MTGDIVEKHQLAGFDERARGFNRVVEVHRIDRVYKAVLKYEAVLIAADGDESGQAALHRIHPASQPEKFSGRRLSGQPRALDRAS